MIYAGVAVSLLWLAFLGVVVYLSGASAFEMPLNEWGDFLAGGFAPLAFMWLVIGYFQQGKELNLSRKTLALQVEELKNSVAQQKALVQATQEDIAFAKGESERARLKSKQLAQPRLVISRSDVINYKNGSKAIEILFINYGSEIKDVVVTVAESDLYKAEERSTYSYRKWERDEVMSILVACEALSIPKIECIQFNLVYLDGLTEKSAACLWIDMRDGKAVGINFQNVEVV